MTRKPTIHSTVAPVTAAHRAVRNISAFPGLYFQVRDREARICSDEQLRLLPFAGGNDPLAKEWKLRARSALRLERTLRRKGGALRILEVGCGNGWLSHRLAAIPRSTVTGLDPHGAEIAQARRVFRAANLQFVEGFFPVAIAPAQVFDVIVFAASFQYFSGSVATLAAAAALLVPGGRLFITDTPFYAKAQQPAAAARSKEYFSALGFPDMTRYYFHHSLEDLSTAPGVPLRRQSPTDGFPERLRSLWQRPSPFPFLQFVRTP